MLIQFFSIGLLVLLTAMLPGPDVALVIRNTVLHTRRAGLFTSLGIASGVLVHLSYCILGLAIVISESVILFNIIKYIGAIYLVYIGIQSILTKHPDAKGFTAQSSKKNSLSDVKALKQGFLCNVLNPKATLFFLALFTAIIKPNTGLTWELIYGLEIFCIVLAWFCGLTFLLSHPRVLQFLSKIEKYLTKIVGVFLIGFGVALALVGK